MEITIEAMLADPAVIERSIAAREPLLIQRDGVVIATLEPVDQPIQKSQPGWTPKRLKELERRKSEYLGASGGYTQAQVQEAMEFARQPRDFMAMMPPADKVSELLKRYRDENPAAQ